MSASMQFSLAAFRGFVQRHPLLPTVALVAGMLALSAVLLVLALNDRDAARETIAMRLALLDTARSEQSRVSESAAQMAKRIDEYRRIERTGLFVDDRREHWADHLVQVQRAMKGIDTSFTLRAPHAATLPAEVARVFSEAGLAAPELRVHEMVVELAGIHEIDLLAFLDRLNRAEVGPFRLSECHLARREQGLAAACTLQWLGMPMDGTSTPLARAVTAETPSGASPPFAVAGSRLLLSPAQRRALDDARRAMLAGTPGESAARIARLDGVLLRGGRHDVAWINGEPLGNGSSWQGTRITVQPSGRVALTDSDGRRRVLASGEQLDLATFDVIDVTAGQIRREGRP